MQPLVYNVRVLLSSLIISDHLRNNPITIFEIAKELKLNGLTNFPGENKHKITIEKKEINEEENLGNIGSSSHDENVRPVVPEDWPTDETNKQTETSTDYSGETLSLDEKISSLIVKGQNLVTSGGKQRRAHICTVCGKEAKWNIIRDHIEANHLEGVTIPCSFCDQVFR